MDYLAGDQLSLIAEDEDCADVGDWARDVRPVSLREKSIEEIRAYFVKSVGGKHGGQIKNSPDLALETLPPIRETDVSECPPHGSAPSNSIFTRTEGDDGTWIEKERRGNKIYRYLRWRELDGRKPSKYLGTA